MYVIYCCSVAKSCPTICDPMGCSLPGFSVHWDSPGKNTGVGCHFLLQGIFLTQGLSSHLLHLIEFTSALAGRFFTTIPPGKPTIFILLHSQCSEKDDSGHHPSTKQNDEGSRKLLWGTVCILRLTDVKGRDPRA